MAVLLGVLVAISFGTGDFFGGRASTKFSTLGVLVISQACGVAGGAILVVAVHGDVTGEDLVFGAFAGAVNVIGLGILYGALARHSIGVVAPVTAVVASVVPVGWGLAQGERPSVVALVGVVAAICAGALIGREQDANSGRWAAGVPTAALAGLALGTSLVLFSETSPDSGMAPVLAAHAVAALLVWGSAVGLWLWGRSRPLPNGAGLVLAVAAGVLDVTATALLVLAIRRGLIVIVSPIASLAPGFTVVLAWIFLGEKLATLQRVGLVIALAGLVLVSLG